MTTSAEYRELLDRTTDPMTRNMLVECLVGRGDARPDEFRLLHRDGTEWSPDFSVPYLRRLRRVRETAEREHEREGGCELCAEDAERRRRRSGAGSV